MVDGPPVGVICSQAAREKFPAETVAAVTPHFPGGGSVLAKVCGVVVERERYAPGARV